MKKNYFLVAILSFTMISMNAQFAMDDMESYGGGNAPINEGHWSSWDGTDAVAMFSSGDFAQSGSLSGYVDGSGIDPLLLLGDKIFGDWGLKMSLYVPTGSIGYYNIQGQEVPGIQWVVGNITLGNSGIGGDGPNDGRIDMSTADETDDWLFTFPNDVWFDVIMNFDFSLGAGSSTWALWVDGVEVVPTGTDFADGVGEFAQALGGLNLFSTGPDMDMYVDDVEYINDFYPDPTLGSQDFGSKGFRSALSNNILTLRANEEISNVSIYNMLGQEVYRSSTNTSSINLASFANGTYIVRVNINGTEGTVKIVK